MIDLLVEALEKTARPGVLGAIGAKIERRCAKDLRAYFGALRPQVLELAKFADYGKDAALMGVDAKLHNLLRIKREVLLTVLETNIEGAFRAALRQDVVHEQTLAAKQRKKFSIEADEFREWPDSSGFDDHGREPGTAPMKDGVVQPEPIEVLAKRVPLASATKDGIRHDIVHGVDKQVEGADAQVSKHSGHDFQRHGTHFYTDTKTGKKVMGGYFMGWPEHDSPKNYNSLSLADKAKDELKQQQKWGYRHNFDFHVGHGGPTFKEADDPLDLGLQDKVGPTGQDAVGIAEAEFREWPDASGFDDHGRDDMAPKYYHGSDSKHSTLKADPVVFLTPERKFAEFHATKHGKVGHVHEVSKGDLLGHRSDLKLKSMTPEKIDDLHMRPRTVAMLRNKGYSGVLSTDKLTLAWFSHVTPGGFKEADDQTDLGLQDKLGPTGQDAVKYAKDKAAGLVVGIDETTRKQIREAVSTGIDEMLGVPGTSRLIRDLLDSWDTSRADMIASTEMNDSMSEAQFRKMQALSVQYKQIILSDDACEICQENADADPLPIDEFYPSGDLRAPFHPNCRCATTGARPPEEDAAA